MKRLITTASLLLLFAAMLILPVYAQEAPNGQLFAIHEDVVIPAKVSHYEEAAKGLKSMLEENGTASMPYQAANMMDFTYLYITPISSLADVEKLEAGFGELQQKVGEDAFKETMGKFAGCYLSHRDYLIRMHPDLSYNPEYGADQNSGMNYRSWDIYHVYPGKEEKMIEIAKKWKALNEKHNIKEGYRIYIGEMGTDTPILTVVHSAKKLADLFDANERNMKSLGEEGQQLWSETLSIVHKYEQKFGMMRPDLSYQPEMLGQAEGSDSKK